MAVESCSDAVTSNNEQAASSSKKSCLSPKKPPAKRTKNPGVRVVGSLIYDSEKGTSCHQCRQKTLEISAGCKKVKSQNKPCPLRFCRKCLLNRYGENAEEVDQLGDWICPKCRGICNCSHCRPKKGYEPTGQLYHTAKRIGFSSVHELLNHQGFESLVAETSGPIAKRVQIDENDVREDKANPFVAVGKSKEALKMRNQRKRKMLNELMQEERSVIAKPDYEEIVLPQGIPVLTVAGVELSADDVGPTLQFLEFCNTFSEVLQIQNGQPESILREIARGCGGRREVSSPVIQFQIKLLTLIQKDMGDGSSNRTSWFEALGNCINDSPCAPKELQLVFPSQGAVEFHNLDSSKKLRLLNFLCDEILGTKDMRSWMEEENTNFLERKKEAKEKVCAAKRKEKIFKQNLKDDFLRVALSMIEQDPISVPEHEDLMSEKKSKSGKAHAEVLESINLLPEIKRRSDAVRTEPLLAECNGRTYWRLTGCSTPTIMLQEIGNSDLLTPKERWYTYDEENEKVVENRISQLSSLKVRARRSLKKKASENPEEKMNDDSLNSSRSPNCSMEGVNGAGYSASD